VSRLRGVAASTAQSYLGRLGEAAASAEAPTLSDERLCRRVQNGIDHIDPGDLLERVSSGLPALLDQAGHIDPSDRARILEAVIRNLTRPPPSRRPLDARGATYSWARHHWARGYVGGLSAAYQTRVAS
jgi:hypothetical protein